MEIQHIKSYGCSKNSTEWKFIAINAYTKNLQRSKKKKNLKPTPQETRKRTN